MYLAMLQNPSSNLLGFSGTGVGNFNAAGLNPLLGMQTMPMMGVGGLGSIGHSHHHAGSAASFHQPAEKN